MTVGTDDEHDGDGIDSREPDAGAGVVLFGVRGEGDVGDVMRLVATGVFGAASACAVVIWKGGCGAKTAKAMS